MPWWVKPVGAVAVLSILLSLAMGGPWWVAGALLLVNIGLGWFLETHCSPKKPDNPHRIKYPD